MPNQAPSTARARAVTLRRVLTTLSLAAVVLILLGGAVVAAAVTMSTHEPEPVPRRLPVGHAPAALDSWGMAASGLRSVGRFLGAIESAGEWYAGLIMRDHWLRIGRCEQPGGGYGGIEWHADGWTSVGHFQGGLGISTGMWREHSAGYPSSALLATPEEQMAVATRIYHHYGPGAWGCKA
jgi:hypothetical protein